MAPLVVAHRGASAIAPENTLEAFEKAIEIGAHMVEFDVRATSDGMLVVFHDAAVGGKPLADWSYDELQAALPHRPPLLDEVVAVCAGRIALDVELKEGGLEEETLRIVSERFSPDAFVVTSFLADVVATTKELRPDVRVGLLLAADAVMPDATADFLAPHVTLLDREVITGEGLVVWTVNDEARLRRYLDDPRVAAVITDDPELALGLRRVQRRRGANERL